MTLTAIKYAKVLWAVQMPVDALEDAAAVYEESPVLQKVLTDPEVHREDKYRAIDRIFPEATRNFLKVLCRYAEIDSLPDILAAYKEYVAEHNRVLHAKLRYVTPPDEEQTQKLAEFLKKEFQVTGVEIEQEKDPSLVGGFVLSAEGREYDWSLKGRLRNIENELIRR